MYSIVQYEKETQWQWVIVRLSNGIKSDGMPCPSAVCTVTSCRGSFLY